MLNISLCIVKLLIFLHFVQDLDANLNGIYQGDNVSFWGRNSYLYCGKTLKVVFMIAEPGTEEIAGGILQLENGSTIHLDGSGVPLAWDLRDALNLTLEMYFSNSWDTTWDLVANGTVDLAVSLLTTVLHFGYPDALKRIVVLHPVLSMSSDVYFRQPSLESLGFIIFGLLSKEAWLLLTSVWLLCVIGCFTISQCGSDEKFFNSDMILWAVAVIHGKGYPVGKRISLSLRIAIVSAMCLSVVSLVIYTAKIVSFISIKTDHVKTPEDLLSYDYILSSWSPVHTSRIFKQSKNRAKLIETAQANFVSGEDSMIKLADPKRSISRYAFLTQSDGFHIYGQYHNHYSHELCGFSTISSSVKASRAMYMRKESELREVVNWALLQLVERGMNHRHQISYKRKYEFSCISTKQQFEELSLSHTLLMFLILIVGAFIAILVEFVLASTKLFIH